MTQLSEALMESSKGRNVSPITGDGVDFYWEMIWERFREVPGWLQLYDEAGTYQHVKMGHLHVWAYSDSEIRGILITRINVFPKCKVLDVIGVSGISGLEFMEDLDSVCENLARQNGCQYIVTSARPGMSRVLQRKHQASEVFSILMRHVGLLRRS